MTFERLTFGKMGEKLAEQYLVKHGYVIVERNYRGRLGELDFVANEAGNLVFIEVKSRRGNRCGEPFEAVTARKQGQLAKVAHEFIARHGMQGLPARFDVVSVFFEADGRVRIDLIRNAFDSIF